MALIVQKFGGTSVGDAERIRAVADHVARTKRNGNDVVVVVSAMGKETDKLIRLAQDVSTVHPGREMDMLLTAGERKSMALLCMALAEIDCPAQSFTGSQAGIVTDTTHQKAKIIEIKGERIRETLDAGNVAVVAGFQGVSTAREVTTLGRGGSDTTAVALAASLGASCCEIYTDVTGVFSADPRVEPNARKLAEVSFDEMLEMSATGSGVLALRSVDFAKNHDVEVHVRSAFTWEPGTWIRKEVHSMEDAVVSAVTHDVTEAKITITGLSDVPGTAARLFRRLADSSINVDMIVQNISIDGKADISFTIPETDLPMTLKIFDSISAEFGANDLVVDSEIGRVSVVGAGMKSSPGVAAMVFEVLAENSINLEMISTSTIRISCVIHKDEVEKAVRALHKAFELGGVVA